MAYDKRFGIDIPTDKQVKKYMTKLQVLRGLDKQIRELMQKEDLASKRLALQMIVEFAKLARYYDQEMVTNTTNVMFVTKAQNDEEWARNAREHDKILTAKTDTDLATDTGEQSGSSD